MSEYKYACPVCGQHMMCDSSQAGMVMECPTCFQKITAPQAPTDAGQKLILTGTKPGERPLPKVAAENSNVVPTPKNFPLGLIILLLVIGAMVAAFFIFYGGKHEPVAKTSTAVGGKSGVASSPATDTTDSDVGNNIALHKPSFASSQETKNPVQNGNDGNSQTRWCASSGNVPQWWEVDLGSIMTITNTQIIWEHDAAYKYVIQVSSDNARWTKLVDHTANSAAARMNSDDFSASGRYVRIVVTGLSSGGWASFYEFKVFGSSNETSADGQSARQPGFLTGQLSHLTHS
jgi:DNA-directed RNA polymerase subunit RPC12/RpoP